MEVCAVDTAAVSALQDVVHDVFDNMKAREPHCMPNIATMDTQPEYRWFMRPKLLGFMLQAQESLGLNSECFSLSVNILDRYASRRVVNARHHQLVGAVCVWISAKYLDLKCRLPTVRDIEYLCAGAFTSNVIAEMELHILNALDWNVAGPTAVEFVDYVVGNLFSDQALVHPDPAIYCSLAKHICECSLFKRELLSFLPSQVASTAVEAACVIIDVCCGVDRQFMPVPGSNRQLFDEIATLIVAPPLQMEIRATHYEPYNVVALLAQFVHMSRDNFNPDRGYGQPQSDTRAQYGAWDDQINESPYSTNTEWGFTSPATVSSVGDSPYSAHSPYAKGYPAHHPSPPQAQYF